LIRFVRHIGWLGLGLLVAGRIFAQSNVQSDSAFSGLSMQELQNAKAYYSQELEALVREKKELIQKSIEDGERLLPGADPKMAPEILIRLADLYYHQEKDDFLDRMKAYEDSVEMQGGKKTRAPSVEPRLVFRKSIQYYQRIIDRFPSSDLVDDAMYYRAFLYEEMGENAKANSFYLQVSETYPQSSYLPEVYMRLGEYHFNPPINNPEQAIGYYRRVTDYRKSPRYYEALYKLGWSNYRLNRFAEAISYFTTLIEQFNSLEKTSPLEARAGTDLRNEAVDYIAVCFLDYGGVPKAVEYLDKIGRPGWGQGVLKKMGDVYRVQKEEYATAVSAYTFLLGYSTFYADAPQIQRSIVDCYRATGDPNKVSEARQKLFSGFRIGSAWWNQNLDERSRLQAYKLGEQALRDDIVEWIKKAERQPGETVYQQVAEMAGNYLQAYPEDLNALLVRWNLALILDSKLHRYREALQEYLTISLVYDSETYETFAKEKGLATVQDAALNAIVVADTLVRREYKVARRQTGIASPNGAKTDEKKEPVPLSDAEKWLTMACDNYIKLYPFDAKTTVVLANTGALFYTHNQFNEALRYFKTLTKNFPQSEQSQHVQLYILDSYFGKGDYESAEVLSKNLLKTGLPAADVKAVEKRLAESIFLRAQTFSEQGLSQKAAAEYLRMALEVPTADFADRAVFNAGRENEKIKEYAASVRAYEILRTSYGGSVLLPDALNNLAINYAALGDYNLAAARCEELSAILKDNTDADAALYNAFAYYSKAENWQKTAATGKDYSTRFSQSQQAPLVCFKTGECYVRLKEDILAARTFIGMVDRFPNSALGVEACFRAGELFSGRDSLSAAEKAYTQAYVFHEKLKRGRREGNEPFAAEGLFQASLLLEKRFRSIALVLPPDVLNRRFEEKQTLLRQLTEQYAKVAAFQNQRMPESLYRIGEAHEHFANSWAAQELPRLDPTAKVVKQKEINGRTTRFFRQALSSCLTAVKVMGKWNQKADSSGGKNAADSLRAQARIWDGKFKSKASEILFRMAEINAGTVAELMAAPLPAGMTEMARLEYRSQLLLRAISPIVWVVVDAHKRNLAVSDSLGFQGGWADSSRSRILAEMGLLPSEYQKLAFQALDGFRKRMVAYERSASKENTQQPAAFVDEMVNFLELSKTYCQNSLAFRKDELSRAVQMGLLPAGIQAETQAMVRFALSLADSMDALAAASRDDQKWAKAAFESKNDPKFEEMLAVYEDNVFFLNEKMKAVLELAHAVHSGLPTSVPSGILIGIRLIQLDPDRFSKQLNIPLEALMLQPDSTWLCAFSEPSGWEKTGFQPKGWIPFRGTFLQDTALHKQGIPEWVFIRKEFSVPGLPVSGDVEAKTDSSCTFSINGIPLAGNPKPDPADVKTAFQQDRNVLNVRCRREAMTDWKTRIFIRFIPNRILPKER